MSEEVAVEAEVKASEAKTPEVKSTEIANAPVVVAAQGKFCASCGANINEKAAICPKCGVPVKQVGTGQGFRNPGTAAVLSFLFTGLGQVYNGELGKGIAMIVIQMINIALMLVVIGFITFPIMWIYGIWEANKRAKELNILNA